MTSENRILWERINAFAEVALKDIDPQKTQVSVQLDALRPVLEEIAAEKGVSLEDMFILYMDMASDCSRFPLPVILCLFPCMLPG